MLLYIIVMLYVTHYRHNTCTILQSDDPLLRLEQIRALASMGAFAATLGPVTQLHYQCELCRDDAKTMISSHPDESDNDESLGSAARPTPGSPSCPLGVVTRSQSKKDSLK